MKKSVPDEGRFFVYDNNPMAKGGKTPAKKVKELELALKRAKDDKSPPMLPSAIETKILHSGLPIKRGQIQVSAAV